VDTKCALRRRQRSVAFRAGEPRRHSGCVYDEHHDRRHDGAQAEEGSMAMASTIVVGYDGSDCAKAALNAALELAAPNGRLLITYAYSPPAIGGSSLVPPDSLKKLGEERVQEAIALAQKSRVAAEPVVVGARPTEGLLRVAEEHSADMIAVGTRGESPFTGALLGSTAYQLVHRATRPVLVVPLRS
jgi:nucleotide-binding universal stress UspA family protein